MLFSLIAESLWCRFKNYMMLTWAVTAGLLDYLIGVLEDISKEYKEVSEELDKAKEIEKQKLLVRLEDFLRLAWRLN